MRRAIDSSEAEMVESHQIKLKRLEKKKKKRKRAASLFGWPGNGRKLKLKRLKREQRRLSRVKSGVDDFHRRMSRANEIYRSQDLQFAKTALEYYEKSQGGDFEILEPLYSKLSIITKPELNGGEVWIHVSFIVKPKNADCSDVSPKHFFGELFESGLSRKIEATYCSTFEPSNDPGQVCFGAVLRDHQGQFLGAQTAVLQGLLDVHEGEAMSLLQEIEWVGSLGHLHSIFESDSKSVVDAIHSDAEDVSEFGDVISRCRVLLHGHGLYSVHFIRRQANEVAHALAQST